jgi:hypothetical protein
MLAIRPVFDAEILMDLDGQSLVIAQDVSMVSIQARTGLAVEFSY